MSQRRSGPILFCATGITETVGGIASANRNVLNALRRLAAEDGRAVRTLVLNEPARRDGDHRAFGGDKIGFSFAVLGGLAGAGLVVFDHVRLALPVLALPRPLRAPVVVCAHGSEASWRIRPESIACYRAADLVLANSSFTLGRMRERFGGGRAVVCPLGLPPQFAVRAAPEPPGGEALTLEAADGAARPLGGQMLLLVGRTDAGEQQKGHRELLAVMPELVRRFPAAQLVFVGAGSDLSALKALAAASPVAGSLFLTGRASDELLERLYRRAFAFTMPSGQEGFGLAYLEAMNWARPCLACHDDGGADVVVDGETGVLIGRPIDLAELTEAIGGLLADPSRARRLGEAGWRRLTERFTSQAHQDRVMDLLRPLLG
ncbi:phosphatidylinositol alpha-1,6-mannosyltransferase [Caulobacter ginsengisoli]|uniref:Phosphatidylinositol alpha-1,6-mannosyltransferase n=1 Tax=Caulobacter ginsengisoli TaxID=400775 RepID=A0ABU0IM68_9CAUL|nr:glycosyltransferase family 4 protein [Caulobacter ginsengisoli]MDQ0463122.1 phosphatidylinositol alpha-1,6-mannosyltransferase [Caulobacter ginsengisoli]